MIKRGLTQGILCYYHLGAFLALKVIVKLPSTLGLKHLKAKKYKIKIKLPNMNENVSMMVHG